MRRGEPLTAGLVIDIIVDKIARNFFKKNSLGLHSTIANDFHDWDFGGGWTLTFVVPHPVSALPEKEMLDILL